MISTVLPPFASFALYYYVNKWPQISRKLVITIPVNATPVPYHAYGYNWEEPRLQ
ncbi:hypothetical protein [Natranaerobius thermophilus]|uniref:hypothetical protein n=1 Tax=Natranaerobius thermophilus TaxID=375929 RepID=UPI002F420F7C